MHATAGNSQCDQQVDHSENQVDRESADFTGAPAVRSRRIRIRGRSLTQALLGLILLTAAGLKAYEITTDPPAESSLLLSRLPAVAEIYIEFLLGLWLVSGYRSKASWTPALAAFGLFACVSLYKVVERQTSCGCFGKVQVNPWYTFGIDTCAVALLLWFRPGRDREAEGTIAAEVTAGQKAPA